MYKYFTCVFGKHIQEKVLHLVGSVVCGSKYIVSVMHTNEFSVVVLFYARNNTIPTFSPWSAPTLSSTKCAKRLLTPRSMILRDW